MMRYLRMTLKLKSHPNGTTVVVTITIITRELTNIMEFQSSVDQDCAIGSLQILKEAQNRSNKMNGDHKPFSAMFLA